jgi:invasion protein IalB
MKQHVAYSFAVALYAMGLAAPAALAQQAPAPEAQPQAAAPVVANDADKPICKKEQVLGTRLGGKKTCRTKAEWDEFYRQQRAETEQMQRNDMANKTPK